MTKDDFENQLRALLRNEPFRPFAVELTDGRTIEVDEPAVAFDEGSAGFLTVAMDLVEFSHRDVARFRPLESGVSP